MTIQVIRSPAIVKPLLNMLSAVQFENQFLLEATEIDNERSYSALPAELKTFQLSGTKQGPYLSLRFRLISSQLSAVLNSLFCPFKGGFSPLTPRHTTGRDLSSNFCFRSRLGHRSRDASDRWSHPTGGEVFLGKASIR